MKSLSRRLLLATVLALALVGALLVLTQPGSARLAADFTIDYSAGTLVREGHFAAPYDQALLSATEHQAAPAGAIDPRLPFNKPLAAALPDALLSLLPIELAFRGWQVLSVVLMCCSLLLLQRAISLGRGSLPVAALALAAAVPTWATLTEGQATPMLLLGAALVLGVSREAAWSGVAGALAGALLAVKPQYVPAYLAILLATRHWRALLGAMIGATAVLLSPLLGGPAALMAMVHNALLANHTVSIRADESWMGVIGSFFAPDSALAIGIGLYVAALGLLGWIGWRRLMEPTVFAALAGSLAILASPHALPHDLLLLAPPAWLALALSQRGALANPIPALLLVNLAILVDLHGIGMPITPLAITLALAWLARRLRQQSRRERPPLALAG